MVVDAVNAAETEADRATRRYEEALEREGVADLRPGLRQLVVRLKKGDPAAYEEALKRYEEELVPSVAAGAAEPLAAWIAYGAWLAARLEPGRAVGIDASGRADPLPEPPRPEDVVLHLPERGGPAILLAAPRQPSEYQRAAIELLVR